MKNNEKYLKISLISGQCFHFILLESTSIYHHFINPVFKGVWVYNVNTQLTFNYSKLPIETLEKCVKYVQS